MRRPFWWLQALRARRQAARYYPAPARLRRFTAWLGAQVPLARVSLRVALSLLGIAHLALFAFYPGGYNTLFQVRAPQELGYLTLAPVGDTLGFYSAPSVDGFVMYKVFTETGNTLQGSFPDPAVFPRLRYDRWAKAGQAASGNQPELHASILQFVLHRLPSTPLKIEMYAARWDGAMAVGTAPAPVQPAKSNIVTAPLVLRYLGVHDGVTQAWRPAPVGAKK